MKATEIKNITGIYDNDVLNAACECERKEDLADEIAEIIVKCHGYDKGLYNGQTFSFQRIKNILADYGFKYVNADEENETHIFKNRKSGDVITIVPKIWYPNQGAMKFLNFLLS